MSIEQPVKFRLLNQTIFLKSKKMLTSIRTQSQERESNFLYNNLYGKGEMMDWITGIQRAVEYVEAHITEPIDYEEVAKQAYSSSFHFQ